jgi:formylmethanofuran dehydrogenase subunit E
MSEEQEEDKTVDVPQEVEVDPNAPFLSEQACVFCGNELTEDEANVGRTVCFSCIDSNRAY